MKELNWKTNFWIKPQSDDFPKLTNYEFNKLCHDATGSDEKLLQRRGLLMLGPPKKFYISEPYIYFMDNNGLYAVHYMMSPNSENRITYYDWHGSEWRRYDNMLAEV